VRSLLALIMRGRTQAMTASAVCAVLSLLLPPLSYVSGSVVGLATLKQGPREGGLVIAGSVLLAGVFSLAMAGTPLPALAFLAMSWLPAWLLAAILLRTRSQGAVLVAATAIGMIAVLVLHAVVEAPVQWWRELLERFFAPVFEAAAQQGTAAQMDVVLDAWAQRMTRFFGAGTVIGLVVTLLLARWGHAVLDNPGGFGREFRELRVGRAAQGTAAVVGVIALFTGGGVGELAKDLMGPLTAMLAFQGIAVAHGVARERGWATGWLVAMYLLLAVPPHLALPALAVAGLLDGWADFRARARRGSQTP